MKFGEPAGKGGGEARGIASREICFGREIPNGKYGFTV